MFDKEQFAFTGIDHPSTSYVVIDLEWNQPIPWIKTEVDPKVLPGEIIEIGAVKLSLTPRGYLLSKPFHVTIRPKCYTIMNKNVSRVTNKLSSDLRFGVNFPEAYSAFRQWCSEEYVLCGWGNSDLSILKSNLRFHGFDSQLQALFLDVQPLFARIAEGVTNQRSVEYAVDFLRIPKNDDFHSAHRDAEYTAMILKELFLILDIAKMTDSMNQKRSVTDIPVEQFSSFRLAHYLQNPDLHAESVRRTELFTNWAACFAASTKNPERCPACDEALEPQIPWFRLKKSGFSTWNCAEHHLVQGRMRMKKTPDGKMYGSISIRLIDPGSARLVTERYEEYLTFGSDGKPIELQPEIVETIIPRDKEEHPQQDPGS